MDKIEFKTKYEEIKELLDKGKNQEAADLVESINWRKVHNVNALVKASEVCAAVNQLDEAKELLYIAHERSPIGRMILYHLALLCVQTGELDEAKEYYDAFVEIAPHDSLKYIIKYKICKAKGADDTTLIAILEELKSHEFLEEWAYELACLYHNNMRIDKCIDLCDEIILWFGEGPYVERALEMKMIYQPLDKTQEDKYRRFQQKRDGITEIRANELLDSGEIVPETIAIPQVKLPAERFNTINLQAEIKKNIDEIMRATEEEVVSENMENIKNLVEEIPYLQVNDQEEAIALEQQQAKEELDASIKDTFQEYLAEEYDGQISLLVPEQKEVEEQVQGQLTIEDVMAEWEKTKRAAEATLQEAQQQKLESAKNIALMEAGQIMDRLEEAMPKLDAGATPTELLKEEYLAKEEDGKEEVFQIPRATQDGVVAGVGLEIPVVHVPENQLEKVMDVLTDPIAKAIDSLEVTEWEPEAFGEEVLAESEEQEVEDVDLLEASKIVEDMNNMLQKEIDRILEGEDAKEIELEPEEVEVSEEVEIPEEVEISEDIEPAVEPEEESEEEEFLPEIQLVELEPEEVAELVDEKVLEQAIEDELPVKELSEDEKEIFSYFMHINGMESRICQALTGVRHHLDHKINSATGNIIIEGCSGSGKTMLASNIIKVLQKDSEHLTGNVGRIDAKQLNNKDVSAVLPKVQGGSLIIEGAGDLSEVTMDELTLLLSRDNEDVLVVLEDDKSRIEQRLAVKPTFAAMFTEKISIPVFTIDELVNFGKVYALEEGYTVDEMGILAMYNRINLIQRLDHPTSLVEVRDIMEEAMDNAEKGGIKAMFGRLGSKRYDEEGNLILREQDFSI